MHTVDLSVYSCDDAFVYTERLSFGHEANALVEAVNKKLDWHQW